MSPNSYDRAAPPPPSVAALHLDDLILRGSVLAPHNPWPLPPASYQQSLLTEIVRRCPQVDSDGTAAGMIHRYLQGLWREGWQPQDVVHAVSRRLPRVSELVRRAVAVEAGAPEAADVVRRWAATATSAPERVWHDVLVLIGFLGGLPPLEHLGSAGSHGGPGRRGTSVPNLGESRMLRKVRALLAKAESTEFPEEAEALTAKAQKLISEHALDAVLLDTAGAASGRVGPEVTAQRVHIDAPYAQAKAQLLDGVAAANGARTVWDPRFDIATVVGVEADLRMIQLLFASLLTQVTRAMADAGRGAHAHPHHRSRSFRRAFVLAYATRVRQRLEASHRQAVEGVDEERAAALVPLLRDRDAAVESTFNELFPRLERSRTTFVDADGWYAGTRAADRAHLGRPTG